MLLHTLNSEIPGPVKILVTLPVTDRFGQGEALIPQGSLILGRQEKTPGYGQRRLNISLEEVHLPNGEIVLLTGQLADRSGATGVTGKVNNHWGSIVAAAGVSALLSIGTRTFAGTPEGYWPSVGQEAAGEFGNAMSRAGSQIVQKQLDRPPTITLKAGTEVTLQLAETLSFQRPPTLMP
jgi:type IV secretion system protein VirB10